MIIGKMHTKKRIENVAEKKSGVRRYALRGPAALRWPPKGKFLKIGSRKCRFLAPESNFCTIFGRPKCPWKTPKRLGKLHVSTGTRGIQGLTRQILRPSNLENSAQKGHNKVQKYDI